MATFRIPQQKVILCGEYGVGKSSLFRRFATNTFVPDSDRRSTLGLDHFNRIYDIDGKHTKLQLWDTGGMERVASVTSSYYKFAQGAILVYSLDNPSSFHSLSQHMLDVVTYAENAKIFLCGNKMDLEGREPVITEAEVHSFVEQCHNLVTATYRTSCKTGDGVDLMFEDIAKILVDSNRSRMELAAMEQDGFRLEDADVETEADTSCNC